MYKRMTVLVAGMLAVLTTAHVSAEAFNTSKPEPNRHPGNPKPEWWLKSMEGVDDRIQWWEDARFGLFMHWGAYSVLGGGYDGHELKDAYAEHIARLLKIPKADYIEHAASKFRPEKFDAEKWVLRAKNTGMKFVAITAKHHDGFTIYHSKHSDFDVEDTAKWERDPLKELSDACKKHGLKFGVYYSHAQDWYEPGNTHNDWDFPGNPATLTFERSQKEGKKWWAYDTPEVQAHIDKAWDYYVNKSIPQVMELIEDYGVELIWFDTCHWMPPEFNFRTLQAVRELAPNTVVNARIQPGWGDYEGGPDSPNVFPYRKSYWECIQSTLHSWGYNKFDEDNRRPTDYLIQMLATVVSKDGTMMINVGPKGDGTWVENDVTSFAEIGEWMDVHSESIHGAGSAPLPVHNWGVATAKGNDIYLHVFNWPEGGKLLVGGLQTKVDKAVLMKGNKSLKAKQKDGVLSLKIPSKPSDPYDSVIKLSFSSPPEGEFRRPLEAACVNRLHVYDTPLFSGKNMRTGTGKGSEAYMWSWVDPQGQITWKLRAVEAGTYKVHLLYDVSKTGTCGDNYKLTVGDKEFIGTVSREGSVDAQWIDAEVELMRMGERESRRSVMTGDYVGEITLEPGNYDLQLMAAGEIKHKELFMPRTVILEPR